VIKQDRPTPDQGDAWDERSQGGSCGGGWRVNTAEKPSHGKQGETDHRRRKHSPRRRRNGGTRVGHSGRIALRRDKSDMTPESWNSSLLGNGSVNIPAEANAHNSRRPVFSVVHTTRVATQRCCKQNSAAGNQHATIEKRCCLLWPPRDYITRISHS
jgi:hypothetical protein